LVSHIALCDEHARSINTFCVDPRVVLVAPSAPGGCENAPQMNSPVEDSNRRLLRARDAMDRTFAEPLDISALASIACVSESHFIRVFRSTFGETPHRYLQRRRVERSMFLLRESGRSVTDICLEVGFSSLGTFSRTFRDIVGQSPSEYRDAASVAAVPTCFTMAWTRPSSFGEATRSQPGLQ
jgi:transcriptional regulator GlxA family with amidase domain